MFPISGRGAYEAPDYAVEFAFDALLGYLFFALDGKEMEDEEAGVETSPRLFLTYGGLPLPALVRAMCENPARVWGLYPRKGAICVGADADLCFVDLQRSDTIAAARLHGKNNHTPFEGWRTQGVAVATMLRGEFAMREGELLGPPRGRVLTP